MASVQCESSQNSIFDFVIVGTGSVCCVLAGRLSTLPSSPTVCLIERGPLHIDDRWQVAMPAARTHLYNRSQNCHSDVASILVGERIKTQRAKDQLHAGERVGRMQCGERNAVREGTATGLRSLGERRVLRRSMEL